MPDYELKDNQYQICKENCKYNSGYYYDWDQLKCLQCDSLNAKIVQYNVQHVLLRNILRIKNVYLVLILVIIVLIPLHVQVVKQDYSYLIIYVKHVRLHVSLVKIINVLLVKMDIFQINHHNVHNVQLRASNANLQQNVKICQRCNQPCDECNENGCTKCNRGYYLQYYTCIQCSENCIDCNEQLCYNCIQPKVPHLNICVSCESKCQSCTSDKCLICNNSHHLIDGQCLPCKSNCISCSEILCQLCNNKYYAQQSECLSYESNCQLCDVSNVISITILTVNNGYFLDATKCNKCIEPCLTCLTQDLCLSCNQSYYLTAENKCQKCTDGCQQSKMDTIQIIINVNNVLKVVQDLCILKTSSYLFVCSVMKLIIVIRIMKNVYNKQLFDLFI
ncbi:unnamed protein product [Paramecium sonneborni]|uniref:Uncharacterized protein n=1 Tax=Paramecium sonneborni TaxID=65129 RepID=A0A8S1RCA8_9CILI|nr:unnamed protein product [Paramecium sonneborni]